jgi:hypothetical protein
MDLCTSKDCVGVICPAGQVCSMGQCVCGPGQAKCGDLCANSDFDDNNCGGCGNACDGGTSCAKGACIPDDCAQQDCDPLSVCFDGQCVEKDCVGVVCSQGNTCHDGTCGCLKGMICGTSCADTQLDSSNCGGCGTSCDAGTRCAIGECLPRDCGMATCDPLSVCFGGSCVEADCVGVVCSGGNVCSKGVCVCPPGNTACGQTCANLLTSAVNCGGCGHGCGANESCVSGQCVVDSCTGGKTMCGGTCVSTDTDPNNCSACGNACGGGRNCVGGQCQCPQSLSLCGSACVNLVTDPQNCGACSHSCGGGVCLSDGGCSCTGGLTACGNGACVVLLSDHDNCMTCGHACGSGQTCNAGVCGCPTGQKLCGSVCQDIANDNTNCGDCGHMCSALQQCVSGLCADPVTCEQAYNNPGTCPYFPISTTNCGQPTVIETIPISGTLAASGQELAFSFDGGPSDRYDVTATYSSTAAGGANQYRRWRNYQTNAILSSSTNTVGMPPVVLNDSLTGSIYACANPVDFVVRDSFSGPIAFNGNIVHSHMANWNTGGATTQNAPSVNLPDGGFCQQLCGDVRRSCNNGTPDDTVEYYKLTIPPRAAVLMDWVALGPNNGSNADFTAWRTNGSIVCQLRGNFIASTTQTEYKNRVVNNTGVPQDLVFGFNIWGGGPVTWNIAITLEGT